MTSTGRVKWFNETKGFGFIEHEESGKDVFVHYTAIQSQDSQILPEGAVVEFELQDTERGPQAQAVVLKETNSPL
ncbi:MAG: cold-shock protein [Bdellovibrionales bacterium]